MRTMKSFMGLCTSLALVAGCGTGIEIPAADGGSVGSIEAKEEAIIGRGESIAPISRSEWGEIEKYTCDADDDAHVRGFPGVRPTIQCVDKLPDNSYVAHFGYNNYSGRVQSIPAGHYPANFIWPAGPNRTPPTTFATGVNANAFTVAFNGAPMAWVLGPNVAVASRMTRRCAPPPVCPTSCDDGNPCTADTCSAATKFVCVHTAVPDSTSCDDGNACNGAEMCKAGICRRGTPLRCNDGNTCTKDSCDPKLGCMHANVTDGTRCPAEAGCGAAASCQAGTCTQTSGPNCDDHNPCTADSCGPRGTCIHTPVANGTSCEDGDLCNGAEVCQFGRCKPGVKKVCNDNNSCTTDSCNKATGCVYTPVADGTSCGGTGNCGLASCVAGNCQPKTGGTCDDGNPCTADACGANGSCVNTPVADGTQVSDGNACNGMETCKGGQVQMGTPVVCTAMDSCHAAGTCDATSGACSNPALDDGTACNDNNACTSGETCSSGVCMGGTLKICPAADACHTAGSCDTTTGACTGVNAPDGTSCADNTVCNGAETCKGGACLAGTSLNCDDGDPCTADSCDAAGGCKHTPLAVGTSCGVANGCTAALTCQASSQGTLKCLPSGVGTSCDDSNPCTDDSCNPDGTCAHVGNVNNSCSDGNACNGVEKCSATGACVAGTNVVCPAGDQCNNASTCNQATGACVPQPKANGTTCDDGNACTSGDSCQNGSCAAGTPKVCTPLDACHTVGLCDKTSGVCSNPTGNDGASCTDTTNLCNLNTTCSAGKCVAGSTKSCTASDQCHDVGSCVASTGVCSNPNKTDGATCNDSNACTKSDSCQAGVCTGTNPVVCTAQDACHTAGTCDTGSGSCSNPVGNEGLACNDNNICTQVDKCVAGTCTGTNPLTCSAGSCDPIKGCPAAFVCASSKWELKYDSPLMGNVTLDPAGNLFAVGTIAGPIDFGKGAVAYGGSADAYVVKYDATGATLWSKGFGDGGDQNAVAVAADAANHVVVVGTYNGLLNFGGTAASLNQPTDSNFVAGLDATTGAGLWAKDINLGSNGYLLYAALDPSDGNVVVAGLTYNGAVADFGGGPLLPAASSGKDLVLAKFNSATGVVMWAKQYAADGDQVPVGIALDTKGDLYVAGQYFGNAVNFGDGALPNVSTLRLQTYVLRVNSTTGVVLNHRTFVSGAGRQQPTSIAVDAAGTSVAVAGAQVNTTDYGTGPLTSAGGTDAFVVKLSGDLATTAWAKIYGDTNSQNVKDVAVDSSGNVVIVGAFQGSIDFSPALGPTTSAGAYDLFTATLDGAKGTPLCAKTVGDAADQGAQRILVNPLDNSQYIAGVFLGTMVWDSLPPLVNPNSPSPFLSYIVKRQ